MSASEKLKALREGEWLVSDETIAKALAPALPQIVAVVEAAELLRHEATTIHNPEYPNRLQSNYAAAVALAALEEALE